MVRLGLKPVDPSVAALKATGKGEIYKLHIFLQVHSCVISSSDSNALGFSTHTHHANFKCSP